jgi:hypothetical protein
VCVVAISCHNTRLSKQRLLKYIEKSEAYTKEEDISGIKIRLQYMPNDLLVSQELGNGQKKDTATIRAAENKYSGQYYFTLSYSRNNKEVIRQLGSFERYSDMLRVLSFEMGKYVTASTESNDTLALADYAFNQQYGMTNANHLLLVFKREDFGKSKSVDINIEEFGLGIGNTRFEFRKRDLDEAPRLADL